MSEYMKKVDGKEGVCPYCGNTDCLGYEPFDDNELIDRNFGHYPFTCFECGNKGNECYSLTFIFHEIKDKDRGGLVV